MERQLIIIGAGGHGRVVADIAIASAKYDCISFLDDVPPADNFPFPYKGIVDDAECFLGEADFVIGIGNNAIRRRIQEKIISLGGSCISLVHPSSIIGGNVEIGSGSVVMPNSVINNGAHIGKGCIINTCASVDHDCIVGEYSHISPGAHICGTVQVGKDSWIGAGAVVINNLCVAEKTIVGAGATVVQDIHVPGIYVGTPAKLNNQ